MKLQLILPISLVLLVLGMVFVVAGVVAAAFFYPGVYMIALGMAGVGVAGVIRVVSKAA